MDPASVCACRRKLVQAGRRQEVDVGRIWPNHETMAIQLKPARAATSMEDISTATSLHYCHLFPVLTPLG